uniref:MFS transporter n=1 Tax=Aliarcobacter sp. TaxID=2321116 RepID=UPI0040484198
MFYRKAYLEVTAISNLGKEKYGKSRLYGSIGFMIISLILARFLTQPYIALHYYLVLNILTVVFAISLLKFDVEHKSSETKNESFSFIKFWPFWVSLFFMQMSFGGFYNFFTIYETEHGISLEMTSYLWSFGVICEILMLYFQAPLLKNNLLTIIKFCVAITTLRWLLLYLFPDSLEITFFTQSIHAFSFGLYHSSVIIYLYSLYENKKLAQQFMYGVAYGLGGFIGALIAGAVYGECLFLYSALISLLSLIFLYFVRKNQIVGV